MPDIILLPLPYLLSICSLPQDPGTMDYINMPSTLQVSSASMYIQQEVRMGRRVKWGSLFLWFPLPAKFTQAGCAPAQKATRSSEGSFSAGLSLCRWISPILWLFGSWDGMLPLLLLSVSALTLVFPVNSTYTFVFILFEDKPTLNYPIFSATSTSCWNLYWYTGSPRHWLGTKISHVSANHLPRDLPC